MSQRADAAFAADSLPVAVLFAYPDGAYAADPSVDLWDESRDARTYHGPYPVVAHPPCKRWSLMANCRQMRDGQDEGCFKSALFDVLTYGGVLEHPAHSLAWEWFSLPKPTAQGWTSALDDPGWTCEVDQRHYGHEANKPTWLYYVGPEPPALIWGRAPRGEKTVGRSWGQGRDRGRSGTPPAFRDLLLELARSTYRIEVAA